MKRKVCFIVLILLIICAPIVQANNLNDSLKVVEYTEEFKEYLELSDDERSKVLMPRIYQIDSDSYVTKNPLQSARLRGILESRYSLKDVIRDNMVIKNQRDTNSCWTFASIAALETNLALQDHYNNIQSIKVYDFSERHMEYYTSRYFLNNQINADGFNRKVGDGGQWKMAEVYFTNGYGAINESDMPFENNEETIDISKIQNKKVTAKVSDIITLPQYYASTITPDEKNTIKQYIKDYGAIFAGIHGGSGIILGDCYNNETGALYCNNSIFYQQDHAVAIVGWDDNYSVDNFNENSRPNNNGAWLAKNSWGEKIEYTLNEMKEKIFEENESYCISKGWDEPSKIPDDVALRYFRELGFTIENNIASKNVGDNGYFHISYEDVWVYKNMYVIEKASTNVDYNNIYLYDKYGSTGAITCSAQTVYLASDFTKKGTGIEYLKEVSIYAPETYTCEVYVNPNGTSKAEENLTKVALKAGDTETFGTGYHTLEFLNPLKIEGNKFAVVIKVRGTKTYKVDFAIETKVDGNAIFDPIELESGKCFYTTESNFKTNTWFDCSKLTEQNSRLLDGDLTIRAFTSSSVVEEKTLKEIKIATPPTKTTYFIGENFDKTGMVVKAVYSDNTEKVVTDYIVKNGTSLAEGQTSVTIEYQGKNVSQNITVIKNSLKSIKITTPPTKTTYYVGENFDRTGMVVKAVYSDNTEKVITDYTVENGMNLKTGQTSVTLKYEGKTVNQNITTKEITVEKIEVKVEPTKKTYIVGENFDKTGMIVMATYNNGSTKEIEDYTITNGTNLTEEQTSVTIEYQNKTATQTIIVVKNAVESIEITTPPVKTVYYEGEDFDKTGMIVQVTFQNGEKGIIKNCDILDGKNLVKTQTEVTASYGGKTAKQSITVKENNLAKIEVKTEPTKKTYIVGENFDKTGMVVVATYDNGNKKDVSNYSIKNGTSLKEGQTSVTIEYNSKTTTQSITVEQKKAVKIEIKTLPTKTSYIQNKENLDLSGGKIRITYNSADVEEIEMTSNRVLTNGFNNTSKGKVTIIVEYENLKTSFDVTIVEEEGIKNSNFEKAEATIKKIQYYSYTDPDKEEYELVEIEIDGIIKESSNDNVEYYYYLSPNQEENGINKWVKIKNIKNEGNKLQFTICTKDLSNYKDLLDAENIYLYIKETAIKGGNQKSVVYNPFKLEKTDNIEAFLDDTKFSKKDDDTIAKTELPDTGKMLLKIAILSAVIISVIIYLKYRKYKEI